MAALWAISDNPITLHITDLKPKKHVIINKNNVVASIQCGLPNTFNAPCSIKLLHLPGWQKCGFAFNEMLCPHDRKPINKTGEWGCVGAMTHGLKHIVISSCEISHYAFSSDTQSCSSRTTCQHSHKPILIKDSNLIPTYSPRYGWFTPANRLLSHWIRYPKQRKNDIAANAAHSFTIPFSFRFLCFIIQPPKKVPPPPAGTAIAPDTEKIDQAVSLPDI
mgnify:FL=1